MAWTYPRVVPLERCSTEGCQTLIAIPAPHWYWVKGGLLCAGCQKGTPVRSQRGRPDERLVRTEERDDQGNPSKNLRGSKADRSARRAA
jgi:hypothetical protein